MTAAVRTTAVGVFTERDQAERAVAELRSAGFRDDQIGVAVKKEEAPEEGPGPGETKATEGGVAGAVTGGVLGGVLGALAVSLIPGFGPVLAGGLLATVGAAAAAAGAVAGGLVGALIGLGIPEEEARYYHGEVEAGRTLVTVKAGDRYDQAVAILRRNGAYGKGSPLI
jgi:hypothetical protein